MGHLVEVGATEIDQSSRFGAFGIVEEIETIFSSFVLQYKIHTLPLFVFFTLLVKVALHPDATRLFDSLLLTTFT